MVRKGFGAVNSIRRKGVLNPIASHISPFRLVIGTTFGLALLVAPLAVQALNDNSEREPANNSPTVRSPADDQKNQGVEGSLDFESKVEGSTTNKTELTVNGEEINVPQNGSVHKKFQTENSTTTVEVKNRSSGSGHSSSSLQLEIDN